MPRIHPPDNEDKLDLIPKQDRISPPDGWYDRHDGHIPWQRTRRFLTSRTGMPWDDVVAEYVKLDWIPVEQRNFHYLSTKMVEVNTFMKNGRVHYFQDHYSGDVEHAVEDQYGLTFYVHPETKTLCRHERSSKGRWRAYNANQPQTVVILDDYHQLLKLRGIWYEVKAKNIDEAKRCWGPHQPMLSDDLKRSGWTHYVYAVWTAPKLYKHQLNREELKKYGLQNDQK